MRISVKYQDCNKQIHNFEKEISYLALIKHMAIAGQGYMPKVSKVMRSIGMFLTYSGYLDRAAFEKNHFSTPKEYGYDPTDKSHFSNLVGKAIADYLSKQISGGKITFNYEAVMKKEKYKIEGERPDLICIKRDQIFAIEAKGYSKGTVSEGEMEKHKIQSQKGPIDVKFSIASVAYDIFSNVKVKYYDPINEKYEYNSSLVNGLLSQYYGGLYKYVNENMFRIRKEKINNNLYHVIDINYCREQDFSNFCVGGPQISLLLDTKINDFSKNGVMDFESEQFNDENVYIDTDGIGVIRGAW